MKKRIVYHRIVAEGFQSLVEPTQFVLERGAGITMIKGTNGVGKTTLFNAIWWAEYGDNMKKNVETWPEARTDSYRGTRVVIERSIGDYDFMIARHSGFKGTTRGIKGGDSLLVFKKHCTEPVFHRDHLIDAKYKKDAQEVIDRDLGINSKVFMNSIMFGQKMQKLIEADNKDKRALFEELFALSFVDSAQTKAKEKIAELGTKLAVLNNKIESHEPEKNKLLESKAALQEKAKDWDSEKKEAISTAESTIKGLEEGELKVKENAVDKLTKEVAIKRKKVDGLKELKDNYTATKDAYIAVEKELDEARKMLKEAEAGKVSAMEKVKDEQVKEAKESELEVHQELADVTEELITVRTSIKDYAKKIDQEQEGIAEIDQGIKDIKTKCPTCGAPVKDAEIKKAKDSLNKDKKEGQQAVKALLKSKGEQEKKLTKVEELEKCVQVKLREAEEETEGIKAKEVQMFADFIPEQTTKLLESADQLHKAKEEKAAGVEATYTKAKEAFNTYEEANTELQDEEKSLIKAEEELKSTKALLEEKRKNIEALKTEKKPDFSTDTIDKDLKELDEGLEAYLQEKEVVEDEVARYEWWVKKGFAAGGLKAYVFEAMLKKLNQYCLNYYQQLKFKVEFSVDLTKASKPFTASVYADGHVRDYMDLSGGQKQRVDICIAFAMHDLITEKADFNILALDEIFEGMDTEGIETAFELIRIKAQKHSVFMVTHNDIIDSLHCKTVELGYEDGRTVIHG